MSKRVLIVSRFFAPQNAIGAVRPTKLAKYLTRMGYRVTVLCGDATGSLTDPLLKRDREELPDVRVVNGRGLLWRWQARGRVAVGNRNAERANAAVTMAPAATRKPAEPAASVAATPPAIPAPGVVPKPASPARKGARVWLKTFLHPLLDALYRWLYDLGDGAFARAGIRALRADGGHFDAVISTFGPMSTHSIAYAVRRSGLADQWIADFRDEVIAPLRWQKRRVRRYIARVRAVADLVTAVSEGYLAVMGLEDIGLAISNGFDTEDLLGLPDAQPDGERLSFIHCGQMYGKQRDLTAFFGALAALIREGAVDAARVELRYAGRDTGGFVRQATDAGLAGCLHGYGALPRDRSLTLQKQSHVLLLAAWNHQNQQGNVPGKFLEYLMLSRPVLCCVAGDLPGSELAAIIRRTGVGLCYEQANAQHDAPLLKAYLLSLYRAYLAGEPLPYQPNRAETAAYTCEGMARAFAGLLEG